MLELTEELISLPATDSQQKALRYQDSRHLTHFL